MSQTSSADATLSRLLFKETLTGVLSLSSDDKPKMNNNVLTDELVPRGGYSPKFWVGVGHTVLKTLTLFQIKIYDFSYPFSDLTPKI